MLPLDNTSPNVESTCMSYFGAVTVFQTSFLSGTREDITSTSRQSQTYVKMAFIQKWGSKEGLERAERKFDVKSFVK